MKKLITTLTALTLLTACVMPDKPKTECAVYDGWPLQHEAQFETEPVFVPLYWIHIYHQGDTVAVDSSNVVQGMPIHASDLKAGRWVDPKYMWLVIHDRITPNKFITINND